MLTLRPYQRSDQEAVWELHTIALVQTNAYISSGAWDDDLHHIEDVYDAAQGLYLKNGYHEIARNWQVVY